MIFSELYGAYYNTVAKIISSAVDHPLTKNEIRRIVEETAFGESILNIVPAIEDERWQVISKDGTTPIRNEPTMPLTTLELRWLKAISLDPRVKLFDADFSALDGVDPLFTPDDYRVFDAYSDGDPYEDEEYISRFRIILDAIVNRYPLVICSQNGRGEVKRLVRLPERLEYSEKDDKFRLIASGVRFTTTFNLGRIISVEWYEKPFRAERCRPLHVQRGTVEFELVDERNALERVMLHFAHFEKEAERLDDRRYKVKITYDKADETELVIRVLSFGPVIKVTSPQSFVYLIKERLNKQKSCET